MSNWAEPLRSYVRKPGVRASLPSIVEPETFQELIVAASVRYQSRFEPMMSDGATEDPSDWTYRAWLRLDGSRTFGKPAATAEEAVRNLIAKLRAPVR